MRYLYRYRDSLDSQRVKLASSIAVLAGALGSAVILISFIARTDIYQDPEHLTFIPAVFISLAGALAGVIIIWPAVYVLRDQVDEPDGTLTWLAFGCAYAVALPILTGTFLPMAIVVIDLATGNIGAGNLPALALNATVDALWSSIIGGATSLYTAILAAPVFTVGAWIVDRLNTSKDPFVAKYVVWIFVVSVGSIVVGIASFGSPELLRKLG